MKEKIAFYLTKLLSFLQFRVDTTNYIFDKPKLDYQPLPWAGINTANVRGEATIDRWLAVKKNSNLLNKTIKDIGSCVGYFCIAAAEEFNALALGIDSNERFTRIARYAVPEKLIKQCNFINLEVNNKTINFLPITDVSLCFSIWHHWVYSYGLEAATEILQKLWLSTKDTMFFESGEEEIKDEFNMPFPGDMAANAWLKKYLLENLAGGSVETIGQFEAGDYKHYKIKKVKRTLFKISRK